MRQTRHKDWTTTVREARTRSVPAGLPLHSSKCSFSGYNDRSRVYSSSLSSGRCGVRVHPRGSMYQGEDGQVRPPRQEAAIHVSRNNPHPYRIFFPFQTGDRLKTYMVWLPLDQQSKTTTNLPYIKPNPPPERRHKHVSLDNPYPYQSTYQAEIARMPILEKKVMVDHFPDVAMGTSRYMQRLKVNN
ncbi:uncharacterized protein LOC5516510 [Nematostella vectensis]|uniref:uncharacterized protein LOC5516510 n=1 Tax=Nematostella vectensis TaxID=45351 RepID=UPI002077756D|nr:uncharacterized protein LOC5516510 [Nematostella vectensis]